MTKIVFVVQDSTLGGGTSSLSSLYNHIRDKYDVEIFQLTDSGDASHSYSHKSKKASWFCDCYYNSYASLSGWKRLMAIPVKVIAKIWPSIIAFSVWRFEKKHVDYRCVISYGEGAAAHFTSYIKCLKKITWIHYDVTHYAYSEKDLSLYSRFDKVVCVTNKIAEGMRKMYPAIEKRIFAVHNLIDAEHVRSKSSQPVCPDHEHYFNASFIIISIGRICDGKRFYVIPPIASCLKSVGIDFRWIIIGPANDDLELNKLQGAISDYKVEDCVHWLGPQSNPYSYLSKADLLVSTSVTEACPMIFLEAGVLNIPIVTSDFFTADEFVVNGKNGFVAPVDKMAPIISRLMSDKGFYGQLTNNFHEQTHNSIALAGFYNII